MSSYIYTSRVQRSLVLLTMAVAFAVISLVVTTITQVQAAASFTENFNGDINMYTTHGDNANFYHTKESDESRSGSGALKIMSTNSVSQKNKISELTRWMGKIDMLEVTPGERYRFEVYMKTEGLRDSARLSVSFFSTDKGTSWLRTSTASTKITEDGDWKRVAVVVEVPAKAQYMRPEFRLFDRGTLLVDDLKVTNLASSDTDTSEPTEPNQPDEPAAAPPEEEEVPAEEQPGETTVVEEPENIEVNQPPQSLDDADYSINFAPSDEIAANAVPADTPMRVSFPSNCTLSHRAPDDPIVFPGQHGASHSHDFFGDTELDASSTVQSILDNEGNTCLPEDDRSAYWVPTVFQGDRVAQATKTKFYYKAGFLDPAKLETIPTGLRIIAGNANAESNQSPQVGFWYPMQNLNNPEAFPDLSNTTRGKNRMVTGGNGITLRINFPQCWDGENLYLPNSEHMAYPGKRNRNTGFASCPSSHPVSLPMLLMIIDYPTARGGSEFRLSSGEWYTFHADFVNAWHPATLDGLITNCLQSDNRCRQVRSTNCANRNRNKCITFRPSTFEQ